MVNHGLGIQFNRTSVLRKVDDAIHRINRYLVVDKANREIHLLTKTGPAECIRYYFEWRELKLEILQGCMCSSGLFIPPRNLAVIELWKATFRTLKSLRFLAVFLTIFCTDQI